MWFQPIGNASEWGALYITGKVQIPTNVKRSKRWPPTNVRGISGSTLRAVVSGNGPEFGTMAEIIPPHMETHGYGGLLKILLRRRSMCRR